MKVPGNTPDKIIRNAYMLSHNKSVGQASDTTTVFATTVLSAIRDWTLCVIQCGLCGLSITELNNDWHNKPHYDTGRARSLCDRLNGKLQVILPAGIMVGLQYGKSKKRVESRVFKNESPQNNADVC